MPGFMFAYHGGRKPESPEEGAAQMEKCGAWVAGLGDAAINPGTPLKKTITVSSDEVSDDSGPNPMSGYSVIKADNMEAALELAKACPTLEIGGTIAVSEMMEMPS